MATYQERVRKYEKRRKETLVDTVAAGLSYADNVAVSVGLIEDSSLIEAASAAAPFAVIAVTEQLRVILGRKTGRAGFSDAARRMIKTGAAMGVGALASAAAGPAAAVPAAMGTRLLLAKYKSRSLLGLRVRERTERLRALSVRRESRPVFSDDRPSLPAGVDYLDE